MVYAFATYPDGSTSDASSIDDVIAARDKDCSAIWIDLESPTEDELGALAQPFSLDAEAIDDCLRGEQRPRMDEFDAHAFFLMYGAVGPESGPEFSPRKLAVFFSKKHIITVHKEPLKTTETLRARVSKRGGRLFERGTENMLFLVIDSLVDNYLLIAEAYDERLGGLEEASLASDPDPAVLAEILTLRKEMLELRRLAASQREILLPVVAGELDYISSSIEKQFVHVRDHLTMAIETIDNLRELLHGVRDNYHAALAMRANTIMQTLTIFASLFLPLSLVAGIYGMNTTLWPATDTWYSFWMVLGIMAAIALVMLAYFRRKRWL